MIRFHGLTLSYGGRVLLHRADLTIFSGERVALVGLNGSGKTSLLAAIDGCLLPEEGRVECSGKKIVRLLQALPSGEIPAWQYVAESDPCLNEVNLLLKNAQESGCTEAIAAAYEQWNALEGDRAASRANFLLAGLGFDEKLSKKNVNQLSGGYRMRLNLAKALFCPSDVLLLDEPTNHLDLDAILWLERWLSSYSGTCVVVSHDRFFLDRVVVATLHLDQGELVRYAGGYTDFERMRVLRQQQDLQYKKTVEARRSHLRSFIDRFRAQATRARQVQSRIKALDRMAEVKVLKELKGVTFRLPEVLDAPDCLLTAKDLCVGYSFSPDKATEDFKNQEEVSWETQSDDTVLGIKKVLGSVNLTIFCNSRIGILGRNGAGKSTLIRTLVGELTPLSGRVQVSRNVRIGYFDQQGVDSFRPESTVFEIIREVMELSAATSLGKSALISEKALREYLASFGFSGEEVNRTTSVMSGGEKARLFLASVLFPKPHLLILDEPTNHLDPQTRDALADALVDFGGAVVLVSHDRYLLSTTADSLFLVGEGTACVFEGDLDDYAQWLSGRVAVNEVSLNKEKPLKKKLSVQRSGEKEKVLPENNRLGKTSSSSSDVQEMRVSKRLRKIHSELEKVESRLSELDMQLKMIQNQSDSKGFLGGDEEDIMSCYIRLSTEREKLEQSWIMLSLEKDELTK